MNSTHSAVKAIVCDGCGRESPSEHLARRFERLEQATRYRPIHMQAVFLGALSPKDSGAYLYGGEKQFTGEAAALLRALQIEAAGRNPDAVLSEFQRKGFFLTHVLECALDGEPENFDLAQALKKKLPLTMRKLRTSLRSKRIIVISPAMNSAIADLSAGQTGGEVILDGGAAFDLDSAESTQRLLSRLQSL
ncbi:MAG: hypothetical protein JSS69_08225 [Acidobacteria bacterium]|nr:hypothetical protein [Acidobacteriota bacterium]MBS1865890.1 hypothetical protein [Acidobacteriota bacterium]